jgi:TPR repeat protein
MGVFHDQGMAGLPADPEVALEYFIRAAEHPRPFNMALYALGNYYRYGKGGVSEKGL